MSNIVSRRALRGTAVAFGVGALMAASATAASATTLEVGGVDVLAGTTISAPLSGAAVLTATGGSASCSTGSLSGVVGTNPAASVVLTSQTLTLGPAAGATHCVNSGLPFLVRNASLTSVTSSSVSATSGGGTIAGDLNVTGAKVTANITSGGLPGTCVFDAPSASGKIDNVDHSVTFTNVPVTTTSGLCGAASPATFSATFKPIKTAAGGLVTVT